MDFTLPPDLEMLRKAVREFARKKIAPHASVRACRNGNSKDRLLGGQSLNLGVARRPSALRHTWGTPHALKLVRRTLNTTLNPPSPVSKEIKLSSYACFMKPFTKPTILTDGA